MKVEQVPRGFFYLEDANGEEIPGSRREIGPHMDWDKAFAVRNALEARRGRDQSLNYRSE